MKNRNEFAKKLSIENKGLMKLCEQTIDVNIDKLVDKISGKSNKFVSDLTYEIYGLLAGKINGEVEEKWEVVHQEIVNEVKEKLNSSIN